MDTLTRKIEREQKRAERNRQKAVAQRRLAVSEARREAERQRAIREDNRAFAASFVRWANQAGIPRELIDPGDRAREDRPARPEVEGWVIKRYGLDEIERRDRFDAVTEDERIVRVYYGGLADIKASRVKRVIAKFKKQHGHPAPRR